MISTHFLVPIFLFVFIISWKALPCYCFTSFVFGDSLVDAGNNDYIFTLSKANSPPYGIDFKASGGHPTGRFTNGRTIADIVGINYLFPSVRPPIVASLGCIGRTQKQVT